MIDTKELRQRVEEDGKRNIDLGEIHELLDRLESAESEALEEARLNGMGSERETALIAKLEVAEKERDALRAKVSDLTIGIEYLSNLKKSYEELIGELQDERDALRAAIKASANSRNEEELVVCQANSSVERIGMTYEAWRISYQSSEQAARAAYAECDELRVKIETAENDAAHQKALADSALRAAEGWERKCGELRAKIAEMEQQEPAGTLHDDGYFVWRKTAPHQSNYAGWKMVLYLAPGAKGE